MVRPHRLRLELKTVLVNSLTLAAVVLFIVGLAWFLTSGIFRLKHIDCQLDGQACREKQLETLANYEQRQILTLKPGQIEQVLLSLDLSLKSARVNLNLPDTLRVVLASKSDLVGVNLIKTQPPASPSAHPLLDTLSALASPPAQTLLLSSAGDLLPSDSASVTLTSLFILTGPSTPLNPTLKNFYLLYRELTASSLIPAKLWLFDPYAGLSYSNSALVMIDLRSPVRESVNSLQQIISSPTISLNHAIIDLRFDKPVITRY